MSEGALRALTLLGLGSLAASLVASLALRALPLPSPASAAALCGAGVQLGLYALLIGAWQGTGGEGWPVPTAGFLLCSLPLHALCVGAAVRHGRRTLPATTALFVLAGLGMAWATRIGQRDPALVGVALTSGVVVCAALSTLLDRWWPRDAPLGTRPPLWRRALASPWTWCAVCLALLVPSLLAGVRTAGGTVVGLRIGGVFLQPTELAYKLSLPPLLAAGLLRYAARRGEATGLGRRLAAAAPLLGALVLGFVVPLLLLKEHGTLVLGGLLFAAAVGLHGHARDLWVPALVAALLAAGVAWTEPRVRQRVTALLAPACAPGHEGDQRCTAATAAASSDLLGQGIAAGLARAVPQAETDFPVSGFAEELGLPGVVLLWLALALGATFVLREPPREHAASLAAAAAQALLLAILLQAAWSHWMNLGLFLPVMGVPFPWLSFSGTTVFASTVGAGAAALLAWRSPA